MSKTTYVVCEECLRKLWLGVVPATDRSETDERFYVHEGTKAGDALRRFLMKHTGHRLRCLKENDGTADEYAGDAVDEDSPHQGPTFT